MCATGSHCTADQKQCVLGEHIIKEGCECCRGGRLKMGGTGVCILAFLQSLNCIGVIGKRQVRLAKLHGSSIWNWTARGSLLWFMFYLVGVGGGCFRSSYLCVLSFSHLCCCLGWGSFSCFHSLLFLPFLSVSTEVMTAWPVINKKLLRLFLSVV